MRKNNDVVNLLLAFLFMFAVLYQWFELRKDGLALKKDSFSAFDKSNCLKQLNVDVIKQMTIVKETKCQKLYLRDSKEEPTNFCFLPFTNYLTVERGIKCETNGFWIRDRNKCIKTFIPIADSKKDLFRFKVFEHGFTLYTYSIR